MKTDSKPSCGDSGGVRVTDGTPCAQRLNLSPENGLCVGHDPLRRAEHSAMSRKGQVASAAAKRDKKYGDPADVPPQPKTLEDATEYAAWLTHAITVGRLDPKVGQGAAFCLQRFTALADKRDLVRTVKALEAALNKAEARS